jgi:hypothetical protein
VQKEKQAKPANATLTSAASYAKPPMWRVESDVGYRKYLNGYQLIISKPTNSAGGLTKFDNYGSAGGF